MLHVLDEGDGGVPLVLLHGLGTGGQAWKPQVDALSGERRVLAPDLPGFGRSVGPFSFERACDGVLDLLDRRDLGVVDVCGLSLGAIVALEFALRHPERVRRVILCAGFASLPEEVRSQQQAMAQSLHAAETDGRPTVIDALVAGVPEAYRESARDDLSGLAPSNLAQIMEEISRFDRSREIGQSGIPALVCCGEFDEMNLPLSAELARQLRTDVKVIHRAGHVANLDSPEAFTELLRLSSQIAG